VDEWMLGNSIYFSKLSSFTVVLNMFRHSLVL
jgi:hypothetical protein